MWKISSLIGPGSDVRFWCQGNLFQNKLSASLAVFAPVSLMIMCKTQHVCGFVSVMSGFWLFIWTKIRKTPEPIWVFHLWLVNIISLCAFYWHRITGFLCNKSNIHPNPFSFLLSYSYGLGKLCNNAFTNYADYFMCVSSQIAPSSCPPTTWMRLKYWATASPSWRGED